MEQIIYELMQKADWISAISAIASAVVASLALFVSRVAVWLAHNTLSHQRQHNVLSVKPIPFLSLVERDDQIAIFLNNNGSGPLIVESMLVKKGEIVKRGVVDWMPTLPNSFYWTSFVFLIKDRALLPGQTITVVQLDVDLKNPNFVLARDEVRKALSQLNIVIKYSDVYGTNFADYSRLLDWFGKHESASTLWAQSVLRGENHTNMETSKDSATPPEKSE